MLHLYKAVPYEVGLLTYKKRLMHVVLSQKADPYKKGSAHFERRGGKKRHLYKAKPMEEYVLTV